MEVRWHGRGGQGVVTSSLLLAQAAIIEGKYGVHIPEFGPERRGAPVRSFTRISDEVVEVRYSVLNPDIVVVTDPTLIKYRDMIMDGLKPDGKIIINVLDYSTGPGLDGFDVFMVDAYHIALETLGRPIYNTAMLGALVGATRIVRIESVLKAVGDRFSGEIAELNIEAVKRGFREVRRVG